MAPNFSSLEVDEASNTISGLVEIGERLLKSAGRGNDNGRAYRKAVTTYLSALNATTAYLVKTRNDPSHRSRDDESKLARLWSEASVGIGAFSPDLANRCFIKSQGWLDPKIWHDERFKAYAVKLDDMREALLDLNLEHGAQSDVPNDRSVETAETERKTFTTKIIDRIRRFPPIALAVVLIPAVAAVANLTDAVTKLSEFAKCPPFFCVRDSKLNVSVFFEKMTYRDDAYHDTTVPEDVILNIVNDEDQTLIVRNGLTCVATRQKDGKLEQGVQERFTLGRIYESVDSTPRDRVDVSDFVVPRKSQLRVRFSDAGFQGPADFFRSYSLYDLACRLQYLANNVSYPLEIKESSVSFLLDQ